MLKIKSLPEAYSSTVSEQARAAKVDAATVRLYIKLGLIDAQRLPNGMNLLRPSVTTQICKIHRERLSRRGGHRPGRR